MMNSFSSFSECELPVMNAERRQVVAERLSDQKCLALSASTCTKPETLPNGQTLEGEYYYY